MHVVWVKTEPPLECREVPRSVLSSCIASILRRSVWRLVFTLIDIRPAAHELHLLQRLDLVWDANAGELH
jgi:hypothetical protein